MPQIIKIPQLNKQILSANMIYSIYPSFAPALSKTGNYIYMYSLDASMLSSPYRNYYYFSSPIHHSKFM